MVFRGLFGHPQPNVAWSLRRSRMAAPLRVRRAAIRDPLTFPGGQLAAAMQTSVGLNSHRRHRTALMVSSLLCPDAFLSSLEIDTAVTRALTEDLGRAGDVTSVATIPEHTPARANVMARQGGVISGLALVAATFQKLAPAIEIAATTRDGSSVEAQTLLMTVAGSAHAVLAAERVALNLLGHLSGVATATHEFVRRVAGNRHAHLLHAQDNTGAARAR